MRDHCAVGKGTPSDPKIARSESDGSIRPGLQVLGTHSPFSNAVGHQSPPVPDATKRSPSPPKPMRLEDCTLDPWSGQTCTTNVPSITRSAPAPTPRARKAAGGRDGASGFLRDLGCCVLVAQKEGRETTLFLLRKHFSCPAWASRFRCRQCQKHPCSTTGVMPRCTQRLLWLTAVTRRTSSCIYRDPVHTNIKDNIQSLAIETTLS